MDRKEFGKLIATLRQDLDWTQFQLAEYSQVEEAVISQIERGVKKHFEPDLLFRLANAFHLTSMERREFFLASCGVGERQIVRQPSAADTTDVFDIEKMLRKLTDLAGQLRVPAFLQDVYCDVIAVNHAALAFFEVPPAMLEEAEHIPGGYNAIRLAFGRDLVTRSQIADNWEQYALNTMRAFREVSLRYRAKPYFQYLIKAFRNPADYPLFDRYWKLVSSMEQDKEGNFDRFAYRHSSFGLLQYASSSTTLLTPYGELFLNHFSPLDEHTGELFEQLALKAGGGVTRIAPWPKKKFS
jgi:transcriptional regulator with XRE-family HTH domain